jgi:methionyl-tRNA synthetase
MYVKLNAIQPRLEEWIHRSWKVGKWSPNAVVNADGEIIDARLKGGLRPSPVTRDLQWGIPVPTTGNASEDEEMKGKVLCEYTHSNPEKHAAD